jgi:hypothetical protein
MEQDPFVSADARLGQPLADRSVAALLAGLADETGALIRQEAALAKAELSEKLGRVGQGGAAVAIGGVLAFSGWLVLLAAAVLGLATVLAPWLSALIIGCAVVLIGAGVLYFGKTRLDARSLVPQRTLNSLRKDEVWIRDQLP